MDTPPTTRTPWQELADLIAFESADELVRFLHELPPEETPYTVARLGEEGRTRLFEILSQADPDLAADLLGHVSDREAALVLDELEPPSAAAIVDALDSDEQADVLVRLDREDAEAILAEMEPEEAADSRRRLDYPHDSAGGLMITEYLAFDQDMHAVDALVRLREHGDEYQSYHVRHLYVVDAVGRLVGVVPLRRIVLNQPDKLLREIMMGAVISVPVEAGLSETEDLFDRIALNAVPVVDRGQRLVGVVQRAAVQEALSDQAAASLLKFGGIIGGEESRSMPLMNRTVRRLAFLLPNILLSYAAVSIIAAFEPIVARMTALAVFIPMVANLSGAAGNQAVAVSIRELSLGTLRPGDVARVWSKEVGLGLLNGAVIGLILAAVAYATRPDLPILSISVGGAFLVSGVLAVLIGGALPLVLTRLGVDPAMLSSPILTTLTDMAAFGLTLTLAALLLAG